MLRKEWTKRAAILAVSMGLLTACAKGSSSGAIVATPDLYRYSEGFQSHTVWELQQIKRPPCARDVTVEQGRNCSAIARLVIDYGDTRKQIRAAKGED